MKEKQAIKKTFAEYSSHYEESMDGELNRFWGWSYQQFLEELVTGVGVISNSWRN